MSTTTRARRPQLSEQIDRLDALLDGLADGLNEAIADAAREAARSAVHEILTGLLANPQALAALQPGSPSPAGTPPPSPASVVKTSFGARCRAAVACGVAATARVTATPVRAVRHSARHATIVLDVLRLTGSVRRTIVVATAVGVAVGVVTLVAPGWLAAAVSGVSGAATATVVRVAFGMRALLTRLA